MSMDQPYQYFKVNSLVHIIIPRIIIQVTQTPWILNYIRLHKR